MKRIYLYKKMMYSTLSLIRQGGLGVKNVTGTKPGFSAKIQKFSAKFRYFGINPSIFGLNPNIFGKNWYFRLKSEHFRPNSEVFWETPVHRIFSVFRRPGEKSDEFEKVTNYRVTNYRKCTPRLQKFLGIFELHFPDDSKKSTLPFLFTCSLVCLRV